MLKPILDLKVTQYGHSRNEVGQDPFERARWFLALLLKPEGRDVTVEGEEREISATSVDRFRKLMHSRSFLSLVESDGEMGEVDHSSKIHGEARGIVDHDLVLSQTREDVFGNRWCCEFCRWTGVGESVAPHRKIRVFLKEIDEVGGNNCGRGGEFAEARGDIVGQKKVAMLIVIGPCKRVNPEVQQIAKPWK